MNLSYYSIIACCLLLGSVNCQRADFQPQEIDQHYITFGKGGGMTNQVETYYVLRNGRVYRHNSLTKKYKSLSRLNKSARNEIFVQAQDLPADAFGYQEPGNIYYFLAVHADTVQECTWGSSGFTPSPDLTSFYDYIREQITE